MLRHAVASVAFVLRNTRIIAANLDTRSTTNGHADDVVQPNRLIHSVKFMKAVRAQRANAQSQIDLGERANGYSHGDERIVQ